MGDKIITSDTGEMSLKSSRGAPYEFTIAITYSDTDSHLQFHISTIDGPGVSAKSHFYQLPDSSHHSYLDLFEKLSNDFGLRKPYNRRPAIKHESQLSFRELLTKNLAPDMLYGYGDPAVIRVDQPGSVDETWYYLVSTSNDAPDSFPICRSRDLKLWDFVGFVFPKGNKPFWASEGEGRSDYWAPELHKVGGEFRVYFVARDKETFELCIGVAKSASPDGPFVSSNSPILRGNMIDPHVFVESDDFAYLFWKEDNNGLWPSRLIDLLHNNAELIAVLFPSRGDQLTACFIEALWPWIQTLKAMEGFLAQQIFIEAVTSRFFGFEQKLRSLSTDRPELKTAIQYVLAAMKTPVYAQRLSRDGLSLIGEPKRILENDLSWEAHLVEGMWLTKADNKYYLFYSGNDFSTDQYGVGVAIAESPLGPYSKSDKPLLKSTDKWWAPGHPSVAIDPNGKPVMFMHAFFPAKAGYKEFRALLAVELQFEGSEVLIVQPKIT